MSVYKAQLEQDTDGRWSAWIAELPGCAVWGYTQDEALTALQDAAEAYIEDMVDADELLPAYPSTATTFQRAPRRRTRGRQGRLG